MIRFARWQCTDRTDFVRLHNMQLPLALERNIFKLCAIYIFCKSVTNFTTLTMCKFCMIGIHVEIQKLITCMTATVLYKLNTVNFASFFTIYQILHQHKGFFSHRQFVNSEESYNIVPYMIIWTIFSQRQSLKSAWSYNKIHFLFAHATTHPMKFLMKQYTDRSEFSEKLRSQWVGSGATLLRRCNLPSGFACCELLSTTLTCTIVFIATHIKNILKISFFNNNINKYHEQSNREQLSSCQ